MLGVLVLAVLLGLGLPADRVLRDPGFHVHAWIDPAGRPKTRTGVPIELDHLPATILRVERRSSPFWPRYRRRLVGRPWRDQPVCHPDPSRIAEACEYAHPGMIEPAADGSFQIQWTPEILAAGRERHPDLFPADSTRPSWQALP